MTAEPLHRRLGMTDEELSDVVGELGRDPSEPELSMYSVMWSEHCSYKSSRVHLKRLPTEAPWVMVGPGEGAGVVDVGDGVAVALRMESHNHPSAVEPYQGAATGVGGIIRDVFSMGARPIALMDPLRFGPLDDARNRFLFEGVVSGISGYGNAVGVPTVGGEIVFDGCYTDNPLVNVFCLGVLPHDRLVLARADTPGDLAVLLGSSTGRDGIGGASVLASAGFEEGSEEMRPSVQVGDPFEEKKLIEACLELLEAGLARGVQDLGAAGLSCAASETAAAGGTGMDVDIARVHRRETGMVASEVLTSETQERMLAIVPPGDLEAVTAVCDRWEVRASVVGRVTDSQRFRVYDGLFDAVGVPGANPTPPPGDVAPRLSSDQEPLADVPAASLGDGPVYRRPMVRPAGLDAVHADDPAAVLAERFPDGADVSGELLALLSSPNIAEKAWVWRQYDHQLFLNTVVGPGGDAAVLRVPGTRDRGVALSTDGRARFCALDPRAGARLTVMEAARNVACAGAEPRALVNCLNLGNPEHPEVMWQLSEVVDGIAEACESLGIPVVGGNVSLYNESGGADIDPTPVVAVLGLVPDLTSPPPPAALNPGDRIVVLGETAAELGGSEWADRHGLHGGRPPGTDLAAAGALHALTAALVAGRVVAGVHDCSHGGLAVTLAEMAVAGGTGFEVAVGGPLACFSESASRVVLSVGVERTTEVLDRARAAGVPAADVGRAGGDRLEAARAFDVGLAEAGRTWRGAIPAIMGSGSPADA